MYCQKCGAELAPGARVCGSCGQLQPGAKYCKHCGKAIDKDCVVCPLCGKQVEEVKAEQTQVIINNSNSNINTNNNRIGGFGRRKNKWAAFSLCLFLGFIGGHKFYEGKIGMGLLYFFTVGLFGIGWIVDLIAILFKPNPYYV